MRKHKQPIVQGTDGEVDVAGLAGVRSRSHLVLSQGKSDF